VGEQPFSTTLSGVPFPLPTPQGRRAQQLKTRHSRAARGIHSVHRGNFGKPIIHHLVNHFTHSFCIISYIISCIYFIASPHRRDSCCIIHKRGNTSWTNGRNSIWHNDLKCAVIRRINLLVDLTEIQINLVFISILLLGRNQLLVGGAPADLLNYLFLDKGNDKLYKIIQPLHTALSYRKVRGHHQVQHLFAQCGICCSLVAWLGRALKYIPKAFRK
jgi:hypothetical protein